MDELARNSSTFHLLKKLVGLRWRHSYEILLDITGEFRTCVYGTHDDFSTLLLDTVVEMRVACRNQEASRIDFLSESLVNSGSSAASECIHLLLLCSQNLREKKPLLPKALFYPDQRVENIYHLQIKTSSDAAYEDGNGVSSVFSAPPGFEDLQDNSIPRSRSLSSISSSELEPEDALVNAARCAIEESKLRFQNRFGESPVTPSVLNFDRSRPASIFDSDQWSFMQLRPTRTESLSPVSERPPAEHDTSLNDRMLQFVFCQCVSGPEFEEVVTKPDEYQLSKLQAVSIGSERLSEEIKRALLGRSDTARQRQWARELLINVQPLEDEVTDLTARSSACGALFQAILSFCDVYAVLNLGRSLRAVVSFTEKFTDSYYRSLIESANDESIMPCNKSWAVLNRAEQFISDLYHLGELLSRFEETDGSSISVVSVVLKYSIIHTGSPTLNGLFHKVLITYMDFVWDWFFEASCRRDTKHEFFGTALGLAIRGSEILRPSEEYMEQKDESEADQVETEVEKGIYPAIFNHEQALFLLRGGRSRSLLQYFGLETGILAEIPPSAMSPGVQGDLTVLRARLDKFALRFTTDPENASHWSSAEQSCVIANTRNHVLLTEAAKKKDYNRPDASRDAGPATLFHLPEDPVHFDDADVSSTMPFLKEIFASKPISCHENIEEPFCDKNYWPPLDLLFGEFLLEPLRKIDDLVQTRVLKCFVNKLDLFGHLENLRAHVLLGAGDFANMLVEQIEGAARTSEADEKYIQRRANAAMTFYGTIGAGGRYLRDQTLLNRCLTTALNLYSHSHGTHAELLSLDSVSQTDTDDTSSTKTSLWDRSMEFKYSVDFPLNLILSDKVMSMYSKISDFFLRVLRAKQSLRSLFELSRRNSVLRKLSGVMLLRNKRLQIAMWNFSWQAEHFVSIFGGFEMDQVLETEWDGFRSSWEKLGSIWELRDAHIEFLQGSMRRCLLGEKHKSVLNVMRGGFDIVVKVEKKIFSVCHPKVTDPRVEAGNVVDLLVSACASLRRRSAFLTDVLGRLIEAGGYPHLEDLLTRLNYNYFYNRKGVSC